MSFESGFAIYLKSYFSDLIDKSESDIIQKSNNSELYFEEEDLDICPQELKDIDSAEYVHGLKEQPWETAGYQVLRS